MVSILCVFMYKRCVGTPDCRGFLPLFFVYMQTEMLIVGIVCMESSLIVNQHVIHLIFAVNTFLKMCTTH